MVSCSQKPDIRPSPSYVIQIARELRPELYIHSTNDKERYMHALSTYFCMVVGHRVNWLWLSTVTFW